MASTGKHFVNDPSTLVQDSLRGLSIIHPNIAIDIKNKVIHLRDQNRDLVAITSGGGSGHEPAHSGFVGSGMLTAATVGGVFASPSPRQIHKALELIDNEKGTLIIVKNYTGDILNFGLAREKYASLYPEKASKIKFVIVADDVAVGRTQGAIVGRRGLAGTVLVYKVAGALAKQGGSLDEVHQLAEYIATRVGTVGIGLDHCHVPGTKMEATLKPDEYEIGMGIHNESGHQRSSPIPKLDELVKDMVDMLTTTTDPERSFLPFEKAGGDHIVLLVNNLGGTSELEMSAIAAVAVLELQRRGFIIDRLLVGTFMTSLNMPGVSLTVLLLPRTEESNQFTAERILEHLDDKPDVMAWKMAVKVDTARKQTEDDDIEVKTQASQYSQRRIGAPSPELFVSRIRSACEALQEAEPAITKMDQVAGDGDCGTTLKNGAEGVLQMIASGRITGTNIIDDVQAISDAVGERMDGTSGALYSIFFSALTQEIYNAAGDPGSQVDRKLAADILHKCLERLYSYSRARPPSRTLIDPLDAFVTALKKGTSWKDAVNLASEATERTRDLPAKAGRAAYINKTNLSGVPDPGAWGVKVILEAVCKDLD